MTTLVDYVVELPEDYFEIGIYDLRIQEDLHALWRAAYVMGADGVFAVGGKYRLDKNKRSVTIIPFRRYKDFDYLFECLPNAVRLIGIDSSGERLRDFEHPKLAMYLLGTEDVRLSKSALNKCHSVVSVERLQNYDLAPVAVGSIIMWDRLIRGTRKEKE